MSPKEKFQKHANFRDFASMLQSSNMEYALETALLTLVENFSASMSIEEASKLHHQLEGAKRLIATLKGLATLPSDPKANTIGQLKQL